MNFILVTHPPGQWVNTSDGVPQTHRTVVFAKHDERPLKACDVHSTSDQIVVGHSYHLGWYNGVWYDNSAAKVIDGQICRWMYVPDSWKCDL